jgi:hypothetical protein
VKNLTKAQAGQGLQKEVIKTHGKNSEIEAQNSPDAKGGGDACFSIVVFDEGAL